MSAPDRLPIDYDNLISVAESARLCRVSQTAFRRWITEGFNTANGPIRPRHLRIGGRVWLTREWVAEFFGAMARSQAPAVELPADQKARTHKANKALAARGW
jgi:hypothetical protein